MEFEIIRERITSRGGGIEVALDNLGYEGIKMTAYQNYLGGGMLGMICSDCNEKDWLMYDDLVAISENLKKHYAEMTGQDYEVTQELPVSAY